MRVDPAGSAGPSAEDIPCARRIAFCAPTAAEVFQSVVYQPQIWVPDRFDVDTIHADARDVFARLLRRAASTPPPTSGRILLLWGEAGSGKTHLMRAFRGLTHEPAIGYFAYLQMTTEAGNYGRYLLSNLIASLDQPYAPPAVETSGLMRLSTGLFEAIPGLSADARESFRAGATEDIPAAVHDYADRALGDPRLAACDVDLIRAMIYLQRDDPRLKAKVLKWLRCEDLSPYDRAAVGELVPRTQEEHPIQMVAQIGRLMSAVQAAPLVVCVDQLEDMFQQESGAERFRKVVDTLVSMVDGVPTAVVVLSCLEDYYKANRQHLIRSKVDRLEQDPEPVRLTAQRTPDEIDALVARRLDYLYEDAGLQPNSDNPTCPFTREHLKPLTNFSTRKVLDACRSHHQRCIAAGEWVAPDFASGADDGPVSPTAGKAPATAPGQTQVPRPVGVSEGSPFPAGPVLEQAWNEFQTSRTHAVPDDEPALAGLLAWGIEHCAAELASGYRFTGVADGRMIAVDPHAPPDATAAAPFLVAVCDKVAQGGALGRQVHEAVQRAAGRPVVLVRSSAFPRDARTAVSKAIARVIAAGGRRVQVEDSDWRALVALRAFHRAKGADPAFDAWQRESRPLSQLAALRKVLALDQLPSPRAAAPPPAADVQPLRPSKSNGSKPDTAAVNGRRPLDVRPAAGARTPAEPASSENGDGSAVAPERPAPARNRQPAPVDLPRITGPLLLGVTKGLQPAPIHIEPAELKQHMAFLGAPGSGKTTAALSLIEQLLLRGVPAVMIDRKGDLCRYADPAAWEAPDSGADAADRLLADRLRQLRERVDVVVYTPGATQGRPLSIPLVPDGLRDLPSADREQLAGFAAGALGGMMGYKPRGNDQVLTVILAKAIEVLAGAAPELPVTVRSLQSLVETQDESLLNAVGGYEAKHYRKLAQDLLTLRLQHGRLIEADGSAEPLDVDRLLGRSTDAPAGRARLSIISTQFLGGQSASDFWVAQFLVALDRWRARSPSDELQAVVLLDEADQYLPAMRQPATKAPLESLLRRARSAGLGLMLATQSPGDFDYRCRENIRGWLVGRVTQTTAINKLRPMFAEARLDAAAKLPGQQTGEFYLLRERAVSAVRTDPSLIETRQLPEQRILELARAEFGP